MLLIALHPQDDQYADTVKRNGVVMEGTTAPEQDPTFIKTAPKIRHSREGGNPGE